MPMLKIYWKSLRSNNKMKKRSLERISIGSTGLNSYHLISHREDLIINFCLHGKIVRASLKKLRLVDKYMFMTFCQILKSPNFQSSAAKLKKFWWNHLLLVMQFWSGHRTLLIHLERATMENMHANMFNCKVESKDHLFRFLIIWFMILFGFPTVRDLLLCQACSPQLLLFMTNIANLFSNMVNATEILWEYAHFPKLFWLAALATSQEKSIFGQSIPTKKSVKLRLTAR